VTTVRDRVLPAVNTARSIIEQLGFRQYQLAIIQRAWSGGRAGVGNPVDARLLITPAPKTRIVSLQEVAASAGTLQEGDFRLEKITPIVAVLDSDVVQVGTGTGTVTAEANPLPTGVTQGTWQLVVEITTGGAVGTGAFRYSTNGGTSFSTPATIPASFQVPGIGVLLAFSGVFTLGDTYSVNGTSVGYSPTQLRPTTSYDGIQFFYELTGPEGVLMCTLVRADFDRALRETLYVRRTRLTP
jgi:hypothetical protein